MCVLLSLRSTLSRDDPNFMTEIGGKLREKWLACWMNLDALSPNLAFLERRERILQLNCQDVMVCRHLAPHEATRWRNGAEQWLAIQKDSCRSVEIRLKPILSASSTFLSEDNSFQTAFLAQYRYFFIPFSLPSLMFHYIKVNDSTANNSIGIDISRCARLCIF